MLTPSFKLTQDDDYLFVEIRAPHTNVGDCEITYEGRTFLFSSRPYFLRLHLPADVQPMDAERVVSSATTSDGGAETGGVHGMADYDCDRGLFSIRVPKRCRGEYFPNLEMLSELLKPAPSTKITHHQQDAEGGVNARPLVEMLPEDDGEEEIDIDELYAKQQLPSTSVDEEPAAATDGVCERFGYGFAWRRHGVLARFRDEIGDLLELRDTDTTPIDERVEACRLFVEGKFNPDHYLADLFEPPDELSECLVFSLDRNAHLSLTDDDRAQLKDLHVHELPRLDAATSYSVALTLLDLLLCYSYDVRTTWGEGSVESGWTVAKLCSSLQFLVKWGGGSGGGVRQVLVGFIRRVLSFPLYRHWGLAMAVVRDMQRVLAEGRPAILHSLLQVRAMFNASGGDFRYLFNQLYVDDYCLWVQSTSAFPDQLLSTLREELNDFMTTTIQDNDAGDGGGGINKADVGLDLDALEARARLQLMEMGDDDEGAEIIQLE